jgi:hypothetical protein
MGNFIRCVREQLQTGNIISCVSKPFNIRNIIHCARKTFIASKKKKKSLSPHEKASLFALGKLHLQYCVTGFLHDKGLLFLFYGPASCRKALVLMYNKGTFLIHEKVHLVKQHATWNKSSRVSENLFKKLCLETVSGSCVRKLFQETVSGILCQEAESGNCI